MQATSSKRFFGVKSIFTPPPFRFDAILSVRNRHELLITTTKNSWRISVPKKKSSSPNKSAAIRAYLQTHADAGPTEVAAELKKNGIDVALALVSNVKAAMVGRKKKKKKRSKPGTKTGRVGRPAGASDKVSLSALVEAREFAAKVGGVEQAQSLLRALGKLS